MPYTQIDLFPIVIEAPKPAINQIQITNQRFNKDGILIATIEAITSTKNLPLITKEVYAKGFLRAAVEYMGNDVGAILEELKLIYARMQVIAEVNAIVADGDRPDEKQFETMVEQRLWELDYMMTGKVDIYRLKRELDAATAMIIANGLDISNIYDADADADADTADLPETEQESKDAGITAVSISMGGETVFSTEESEAA